MQNPISQNWCRTLATIFLFLGIYINGFSQTPRFILQTDRLQVQEGETFLLEAVLENIDAKNIQLPDVAPFKIVQGPSTSTSISIINGKRSSTLSYQYILLASKTGSFTIDAATVNLGSKVLKSNVVKMVVSKAKPTDVISGTSTDQLTFIRLEVSDTGSYVGQQVVLNYVLYTRQNIESYNLLNEPDFEGFYAQPVSDIRDQPQRKMINGKEYYVQTIRRVILFPQKTGKYTLGPVNCNLAIPVENGQSSFFFRDTRNEKTITNTLQLDVLPLPASPPSSFSGAVGEFTMKASVRKNTVVTGEAIVIRMDVEGDGDAKIVQAPVFDIPAILEKYEPSVSIDETSGKGDRIIMHKEFEYIFVPEKDTMVSISPEFTYLSVSSGKYETIKAGPFTINILKGNGKLATNETDNSEKELSPMSDDETLMDMKQGFFGSKTYILSLVGILFAAILAIAFKRRRMAAQYALKEKSNSAYAISLSNLKNAKNYMDNDDTSAFYQELSRATTGYIMKKYNIPNVDAAAYVITGYMKEKNVPEELILAYSEILKKCELAKFAGKYGNMKEDYETALALIDGLETN